MAQAVYLLCALTSVLCSVLLFRSYKDCKLKLLLWTGLCFGFLALTNIILVVDVVILPHVDFYGAAWRNLTGAIAGCLILFGLVWEMS